MATATALGVDMINISFIFGLLIKMFYFDSMIQMTYTTGRDLAFYVIGVALIGIIYFTNSYYVLICLVFFGYSLLYISFQIFNEETKQMMMLLMDI